MVGGGKRLWPLSPGRAEASSERACAGYRFAMTLMAIELRVKLPLVSHPCEASTVSVRGAAVPGSRSIGKAAQIGDVPPSPPNIGTRLPFTFTLKNNWAPAAMKVETHELFVISAFSQAVFISSAAWTQLFPVSGTSSNTRAVAGVKGPVLRARATIPAPAGPVSPVSRLCQWRARSSAAASRRSSATHHSHTGREFPRRCSRPYGFKDLPRKWQAAVLKAEENGPKLRLVGED